MSKRLTDTEIWEQDWYIDLPNKYKLVWNYVKDKCDNAGIWRPNKSLLQKIIGEFLQFVNIEKQRIIPLPSGRWFIHGFFIFQYGEKFSLTSPVHKGALKQLIANGVHPKDILNSSIGEMQNYDLQQLREIAYSKDINTLKEAYENPYQRVKDKDIDKDKNTKKGGMGENKNGTKQKGEKFDENFMYVYFPDGSKQELGEQQRDLAKKGFTKPYMIIQSSIY
jgi:hypothetical protein